MNGSVLRTRNDAARMWRVRPWPNDPAVAHLILVDHLALPTAASIEAAVATARRSGARVVRTSAVYPRVAELLEASGFEPIDRLALLRRSLSTAPVLDRPPEHVTRPFRRWHLARAAAVDRDAFGPTWGNDPSSLRDIRRATPHNRATLVRAGRDIAGFSISGAALEHGYLQRLSVGTAHRRRHIARTLVIDSLQWMYRRGLTAAFVNTGVDNFAALALYDQLGFVVLDDELIIAERRFTR